MTDAFVRSAMAAERLPNTSARRNAPAARPGAGLPPPHFCRYRTMASKRDYTPVIGVVVAVVLVLGFILAAVTEGDDTPVRPYYGGGAGTNGGVDNTYENPALGDDGSYDCPPGGGPVFVGSSDPAGLDGDGDGIGCE